MTVSARARVAMHFADGSTIDVWNRLQWKTSFTDPLDLLTFEAIPPRGQYVDYRKRLAKGELVTVLINDVLQGAYLIQTADRVSSEQGAAIRVTLHTPLITPHEGDVDPDLSLQSQTDVPVTDAILKALAPYGFTQITGDTRASVMAVSGKPIGGSGIGVINVPALKHNAVVAHAGTTAYAWCAHIVTRLGVVMRFAADGTLLVSAPDYNQTASYTAVRTTRPGSVPGNYFVGEVHVHETNEGQFSACTVRGQRGLPPLGVASTTVARPTGYVAASDVLPARSAYSSFVAPWKPKYLEDKKSRDPAVALNVAHLELGARAANAYWVEGSVDGWVATTGAIWQPDTIVHVVHELEELDEDMWIWEVTRTQSADAGGNGGQMTKLKIIPKGALILGDPKALARA